MRDTRVPIGDAYAQQLKHKAVRSLVLRTFVCIPAGAVGLVLTISIIGAPLGIPILLLCGKWIASPLQKLPAFDMKAAHPNTSSYYDDYPEYDLTHPSTYEDWMRE